MSHTPHQSSQICTHERRPGTTVCIHCRHAARVTAREKRKRVLLRGGAVAIVGATFVTAGVLATNAIRGRAGAVPSTTSAPPPTAATTEASALPPTATSPDTMANVVPEGSPSPNRSGVTGPQSAPPFGPILPAGESPLANGVTALRTDTAVVVSFDSPMMRTRRPEKFESFVRATLPAIYGRGADSALAHMPEGALARQGDLFNDLPTRGIRIPAGESWEIRLYPESRAGQDGPLVVRYRVSLVSSSE